MVIFEEKQFLQELEYLVNIDSGSGTADGIGQIASFLIGKCSQLGLTVKKHVFDPAYGPCLEVRNYPESEDIDLLLLCHMDTVFPVGTSEKRPFRIKGDQVYGPGCADMKSSILLAFALVQNLLRERPELRLCVALNSDSEVGSISSRGWLRELARKSTYCLGFEAGRSDGSYVKTRKGVCRLSIKLHGKSAHAGVNPDDGASAVVELAKWICRFADPARRDNGYRVNFGVIKGGTAYNVVPDSAECDVDIRFDTPEDLQEAMAQFDVLRQHPFDQNVTAEIAVTGQTPPMVATENSKRLMRLLEEEGSLLDVDVKFVGTGGGSDASRVSSGGAAAIDACGPVCFYMHDAREYFLLDTVEPRLQLLMNVIQKL